MPIAPVDPSETEGAFDVVHRTLSSRALARAFTLRRLSEANPQALSIAMPHLVVRCDLGDLRGDGIVGKKPDRWRFLVLEGSEPIAAATAVRGEAGFEFGGLDEGPFVQGTADAVSHAEALIDRLEGRFEPVLLIVPTLYLVALGLRDLSRHIANGLPGGLDLLIPIQLSDPPRYPREVMTPDSFLGALRQASPRTVSRQAAQSARARLPRASRPPLKVGRALVRRHSRTW
jgi:hypothetical protein